MDRMKTLERRLAFEYEDDIIGDENTDMAGDRELASVAERNPANTPGVERKDNNDAVEEEEAALDGEFIKVEKESIDVKDNLTNQKAIPLEETPSAEEIKVIKSVSSTEWEDTNHKIKELELKLQTVVQNLEASESEKSHLAAEVESLNGKLKESEKQNEATVLDLTKLKDKSGKAELEYTSQLQTLKEALDAQEADYKKITGEKTRLADEVESSNEKLKENEKRYAAIECDLIKLKEKYGEAESKYTTQLQTLTEALDAQEAKYTEMTGEKSRLAAEVESSYEKLKESEKRYEAIELDLIKLKEKYGEAESKYTSQLQTLTVALDGQEAKCNEMITEKSRLTGEIESLNEKSKEIEKQYEAIKLDMLKLKEESAQAESKYTFQLQTLKEALDTQEAKHKEMVGIKEAYDSLCLELEDSKRIIQEFEINLSSLSEEMQKHQILGVEKDKLVEQESKKALELDRLLESAKQSATEMENQMVSTQEELKSLYSKVEENQQIEAALSNTMTELASLREELNASKALISELEGKIISKDDTLQQLNQELGLSKASIEVELKKSLELEEVFAATKLSSKDMEDKISFMQEELASHWEELNVSKALISELEGKIISKDDTIQQLNQELGLSKASIEVELKKSLELEEVLKESKVSSKDMEDKISFMQEELKGLYDKLAEKQLVEETLSSTASELSAAQEELRLSKSKVSELEKKIWSEETMIEDLNKELSSHKDSEDQLRKDILALEDLLSKFKEEHLIKASSLEEVELRYSKEIEAREVIEDSLRNQEEEIVSLKEQLAKVNGEKEALEAISVGLDKNLLQAKEMCIMLEDKLNQSEKSFNTTENLLQESLTKNSELEQKIKSVEDLLKESGLQMETSNKRNLELEDLIQSSNATVVKLSAELGEAELKSSSFQKTISELEQQLNFVELRCTDKDQELKEQNQKICDLSTALKTLEEEEAQSRLQMQAYEERVNQLETSLIQATNQHSDLENKLEDLSNRCAEHENHASTTKQRAIELEDLVQTSHSKANDAETRVAELELLLGTTKHQMHELDEQLRIGYLKYKDAETELRQFQGNVSELSSELEAYRIRAGSLEVALHAAGDREKELINLLALATEEKKKLENSSQGTSQMLSEAQNFIEVLQTDLQAAKEKCEETERKLGDHIAKESETLEKLTSTEMALKFQETARVQDSSRILDLETTIESLSKDFELNLQAVNAILAEKESEIKLLKEKLKSVEDQASIYQYQATEEAETIAVLTAKIEAISASEASLENIISELKAKIDNSEMQAEHYRSENEGMIKSNVILNEQLQSYQVKLDELQKILNTVEAEKDEISQLLSSHVNSLSELKEQHSRGLELHSEVETRAKDTEMKLNDMIERVQLKDSEVILLKERLHDLEIQVKLYEDRATEACEDAESTKIQLKDTLLKLKHMEGIAEEIQTKLNQYQIENESLVDTKLKLSEELASYERKVNELQARLNTVVAEKEETLEILDSSKKTIENLSQQLASEGEKLQSQISKIFEENNKLNEKYQNTKDELEAVIATLGAQLEEEKSKENHLSREVESLKTEILTKSEMEARIAELEQILLSVESKHKKEIKSLVDEASQKENSLAERLKDVSSKLDERVSLDEDLTDIQKQLIDAQTTIANLREEGSKRELEIDANKKQLLEEFEAKHQYALLLEKKADECEKKLQEAESEYKVKVTENGKKASDLSSELDVSKNHASTLEAKVAELEDQLQQAHAKSVQTIITEEAGSKDVMQVQSRDLPFEVTAPSRRKHKKKIGESSSQQAPQVSPSSTTPAMTTEEQPSLLATLKFVVTIALFSMVVGIILGKRY